MIDEQKIKEIACELEAHNEAIGAGGRSKERLLSDAQFVYMVRHGGIQIETLCMMATDHKMAARIWRNQLKDEGMEPLSVQDEQ